MTGGQPGGLPAGKDPGPAAPACPGLDVGLLGADFVARIVEGRPIVGNPQGLDVELLTAAVEICPRPSGGHQRGRRRASPRRELAHHGRRPIDAGSKPSTWSCAAVAVQVPGLVDRRGAAHRGRRDLPAPVGCSPPWPSPGKPSTWSVPRWPSRSPAWSIDAGGCSPRSPGSRTQGLDVGLLTTAVEVRHVDRRRGPGPRCPSGSARGGEKLLTDGTEAARNGVHQPTAGRNCPWEPPYLWRYRVEHEESYHAERGAGARAADPWLMIVPCRAGHICPWGPSTLAASTNGRGSTARKLAALDFATVCQDGSDGVTVLFPVEKFPEVAALMHPKCRRRMTEERRQRLVEAGAKYRFSNGVHVAPEGQIALETAATV